MSLICPYAAECGGCDSQDVPYALQVAHKDAWLRQLFGVELWQPFIPAPGEHPVYYRNKIRFSFLRKDGRTWPTRHGKQGGELAVDQCLLQSELCNEIVNYIAECADRYGWSLFEDGKGWLKHVLVREGKRTGEIMVGLVTDQGTIPGEPAWVAEITTRFPSIVSLYHITTWGRSNEHLVDRLLWGAPYIYETVGNYKFRVSPHSFFQTNSSMVQTLYETVGECANLKSTQVLWDLYAGSATIGIFLSNQVRRVVSIESNPHNVADAKANVALNGVTNVEIIEGTVEESIAKSERPDVAIIDPPRSGLSDTVRDLFAAIRPSRLVYVSCNPLTCLRDCRALTAHGFQIESLQGIDMFPHTSHCEMVATLTTA